MSVLYPKAKEAFLSGGIDLITDVIAAVLVDTGTYSYADMHQYRNQLSGAVGTAQALTSKTVTGGVFDAADVTFPEVSGNSVEAIVLFPPGCDQRR